MVEWMIELVNILAYHHLPKSKLTLRKSSIADNLLFFNHSASYDRFNILTRENTKFLLELKESRLTFQSRKNWKTQLLRFQ